MTDINTTENQKTSITVDDKEYFLEDMTPQQQITLEAIKRAMNSETELNIQLLSVVAGKNSLIKMLSDSLQEEQKE